jgi:hypothetical protein
MSSRQGDAQKRVSNFEDFALKSSHKPREGLGVKNVNRYTT